MLEQINKTNIPQNEVKSSDELISFSILQLEQLLADYNLYIEKDKELSQAKGMVKSSGIFKLNFNLSVSGKGERTEEQKRVDILEKELQEISDRMRFQNPIIWMWYKAVAYVNTPKANLTVGDFANHLKADSEKICDVRMMFFESKLPGYDKEKYAEVGSYFEEYFGGETSLYNVAMSDLLVNMSTDKAFMTEWSKWENFTTKNPDGSTEIDKWKVGEYRDFKKNPISRDELRNELGVDVK